MVREFWIIMEIKIFNNSSKICVRVGMNNVWELLGDWVKEIEIDGRYIIRLG